jgi:hypothetical protein
MAYAVTVTRLVKSGLAVFVGMPVILVAIKSAE